MENLLSQGIAAIVGILALAIIVGIINLLIGFVNRLRHGPERIEAMVIVIRPETIQKYASMAITSTPDGRSTFDFQTLLSTLFGRAVSKDKAKQWIKSAKTYVVPVTQAMELTQDIAIQVAAGLLQQERFAPKSSNFGKVYSVASRSTDKPLTAYLILVGNIPPSASQLGIEL